MRHSIAYYYNAAVREARRQLKKEVLAVLRKHAELKSFRMAMGMTSWGLQEGKTIIDPQDDKRILRVEKLLNRWDEYLKLTGKPLHMTAEGEKPY